MAFSWIAAFRVIPWGEVIAAAPTVARTARDLWRGVSKSRSAEPVAGTGAAAPDGTAPTAEEEIRSLRADLTETRAQLLATSEVLQALAEQDEKLIAAVEVLRVRTRVLAFACVALAIACAVLLVR